MSIIEEIKEYCTISRQGTGKNTHYKAELGDVEARGDTIGGVLKNLFKKINKSIEGEYRPLMIHHRSEYVIIYRDPRSDWAYIGPMAPGKESRHASESGFKSRDEAERRARFALAQKVWDQEEIESAVIVNEEDQAEFRSTAIQMLEKKLSGYIYESTFWQHWEATKENCIIGSLEEHALMRAYYLRESNQCCEPRALAATMIEEALCFQDDRPDLAEAYRTYVSDLYKWAGLEEKYHHRPDMERVERRKQKSGLI